MVEQFLNVISELQDLLLNYLDSQKQLEEINEKDKDFQELFQYLSQQQFLGNKNELKTFFRMIVVNSNNHFRTPHFYSKIDLLLTALKEQIQQFSNEEIFEIFRPNKRILLFLLKSNLLYFDYEMTKIIIDRYEYYNYLQEYLQEIEEAPAKYDKVDLNEKEQLEGENSTDFAKIIRNDKINDFISKIEKNRLSYNLNISESIYETNEFWLNNLFPRFIEFAAFFGSVNIFKNLCLNEAQYHPIIWQCAIHGRNYEIIHIVENQEKFFYKYNEKDDPEGNLKFAIKCHHNEIANYYYEHFCNDLQIDLQIIIECLNSCNFSYLNEYYKQDFLDNLNSINDEVIDVLIMNDYVKIIKILMNENKLKSEIVLHKAIENKAFRIVEFLLSLDDINVNENSEISKKKKFFYEDFEKQFFFI